MHYCVPFRRSGHICRFFFGMVAMCKKGIKYQFNIWLFKMSYKFGVVVNLFLHII